jgi:hypothetical protein
MFPGSTNGKSSVKLGWYLPPELSGAAPHQRWPRPFMTGGGPYLAAFSSHDGMGMVYEIGFTKKNMHNIQRY